MQEIASNNSQQPETLSTTKTVQPDELQKIHQKLTEIEAKLHLINTTLHPPFWKRSLKWIIAHIIPISITVIALIGLWQLYQIFTELKEQITPLLETTENLNQNQQEFFDRVKDFSFEDLTNCMSPILFVQLGGRREIGRI